MKTSFALTRRTRMPALLAVTAVLAGCSLTPTYQRPAAPVDPVYPSGAAYVQTASGSPGEASAADIGWRDFFRDPLLQQLIAISLANNRDLRKAALNVEAARAQYRIRRADLLPHLGAGADGAARRVPADLGPAADATIDRSYQVSGIASWELDLWGRIRSLGEQALASYLALDETRTAAQLSLVAEVAKTYLTLRADQELLGLTLETLNAQQRFFDLTAQLVEAGGASQIDLRRAEMSLRSAQASLAMYVRLAAHDRNALVLLLGQPLTPDLSRLLDEAVTLPDGLVAADLPAGMPSDLLVRRPDVRAAEYQLRGANASIGAARAAFLPAISLTGAAGTASASLDGLFEAGSRTWSFMPRITLPIFSGGALKAKLDAATVRKRIQIAAYEKAIQTAFREVADGLAGKRTLDDQIRYERQLAAASQEAYELARQRFTAGEDDNLSLLDAQRTLYGAQQTLVRTRLARASNLIDLYKALGGGWSEQTVQPAVAAMRIPSGPEQEAERISPGAIQAASRP